MKFHRGTDQGNNVDILASDQSNLHLHYRESLLMKRSAPRPRLTFISLLGILRLASVDCVTDNIICNM